MLIDYLFCLFQEIIILIADTLIQIKIQSINNYYTIGNLLDFAYLKKIYKLIAIDLSKQTKIKDPQKINFMGKLLRNTGATMYFIIERSEETTFEFLKNSVNIL